ncbi:hypothetical protein [Acinetobacter junii]|uniref:hypothetical protein n=1 Tax=Acinetobacter junii TaxID=40215 RepID=UPI00124C3107|nr:hypothetical protein [Acinetobacter junii]
MNAIKFIQQHGVDKAREVVAKADKWTHITKCARFLFKDADSHGEVIREHGKDPVAIHDLKRLVESVDFVEHFGNDLVGAKQLLEFSKDCKTIELSGSVITVERLKQAIADYESIYGGEHV